MWGGKAGLSLGSFSGGEEQELGCFPLCPHPDPQLGKQVCQQMVAPAACRRLPPPKGGATCAAGWLAVD